MKAVRTTLAATAVACFAATSVGVMADCGSKHASTSDDLVATAISAGDFKTLVTALKAADLVETLKSPGPFTVFAPTDEAFAKLPKGALESLLENPEALKSVLLYHVVPGRVMAADVTELKSAKTAQGQKIRIKAAKAVQIDSANVIKTDVTASNGVIHVIDSVLMPQNDIIEAARKAGSFKTLLTALEKADLIETLQGEGPFTVFAPTDDAFDKLPEGALEKLIKDPKKLTAVLTYHVVPGRVMAKDVVKLQKAKTVQGDSVRIDTTSGVMIDDARVIKTDVTTTNGVIHVIDSVIMPK